MSANPDNMKFKTARLNINNPAEKRVYEIIVQNEANGINFKQLAMTAILLQEGVDLSKYLVPTQTQAVTRDDIERMLQATLAVQLEHYTDELLRQLKKQGRVVDSDSGSYADVEISDVGRNFAKGYLQRKKMGDE